jgi:uncharacterized protein HemY
VELAEKAVAELPKDANCWNTLGVARYRAGDYKGAVTALEKSRELHTTEDEWTNPFLLAMARWQLGDKEEARQWFDKGAQWMDESPGRSSKTMKRFRNEAAELLDVTKSQSPPDPPLEEK